MSYEGSARPTTKLCHRDLDFCENTFNYWVVVRGIWPGFGVLKNVYCLIRLLD